QEAGRCLRHRVESRSILRRAVVPETRNAAIDEPRIERPQPRRIDLEPLGDAGAEILDEDVRALHQLVHRREVLGLLGVERDRLLAPVVGLVMRRIEPALEAAERIARPRLLHLDHFRAEIRQQHARGRAGDESAHVEHPYACQRFCHSVLSLSSADARYSAVTGPPPTPPASGRGARLASLLASRSGVGKAQVGREQCASASRTIPTLRFPPRTRNRSPCAGATSRPKSSARWISPPISGCW